MKKKVLWPIWLILIVAAAAAFVPAKHWFLAKPNHQMIPLSPEEEIQFLHLLAAKNDAASNVEQLLGKYKLQTESDNKYKAAQEELDRATAKYKLASEKYTKLMEADKELKLAKEKATKETAKLQESINHLLAAKKCKECRIARNPVDYSFYLTDKAVN